jgi:hypothetical protein
MSNARNLSKLLGTDTQVTTPDIADGVFQANKNLIINGAMQVWQRATAATSAGNTYATVDRFAFGVNTDGAYTTEQSTDTPTGTGYSLKAQVTTADTSISSGQYAYMYHEIEAQNLQHLLYGTSAAKSITLSFWVKSNKTGTYTIVVRKLDTTTYHLVIEYTINSANTWEKKEITISPTAGGTSLITASGGAIANDNGRGFQIGWNLAFGSNYNGATNNTWTTNTNHYATTNQVNWMDSTSNNFYLTQIQLELGSTATPFEHRSYGDELRRCQRYYQRITATGGTNHYVGTLQAYNSVDVFGVIAQYIEPLRTKPAVGQSGTFKSSRDSSSDTGNATIDNLAGSDIGWMTGGWGGGTYTAGNAAIIKWTEHAYLEADAEL